MRRFQITLIALTLVMINQNTWSADLMDYRGGATGSDPAVSGEPRTLHERSGQSCVSGLRPGRMYTVTMVGITTNRGNNNAILTGARLRYGSSTQAIRSASINWHDGQAPQSGSFVARAPANGTFCGQLDGSSAFAITAVGGVN